jgi:hypothetical protein
MEYQEGRLLATVTEVKDAFFFLRSDSHWKSKGAAPQIITDYDTV